MKNNINKSLNDNLNNKRFGKKVQEMKCFKSFPKHIKDRILKD